MNKTKKLSYAEMEKRYKLIQEARSKGGKAKWEKMTPEERTQYSNMMNEAKRQKRKERGNV